MAQQGVNKSNLFDRLNFLIIIDKPSFIQEANGIIKVLEQHSCKRCEIYKSYNDQDNKEGILNKKQFLEKFGDEIFQFVISTTIQFPFYGIILLDLLVPVVTPDWITTSINRHNLARASLYSPNPSHFLKDTQIYISSACFTKSENLIYTEMIQYLGGTCSEVLSNKTTHIVTNQYNDPANRSIKNYDPETSIYFVHPTWIISCFRANKRIPEKRHILSPNGSSNSQENEEEMFWDVLESWDACNKSQLLAGYTFEISTDIATDRHLYEIIRDIIKHHKGDVLGHINDSRNETNKINCYISYSVLSSGYLAALANDFIIGNISWLFYMISTSSFAYPSSKLTFTPYKEPIFNKTEMKLAYTNFFGPQRIYIQKLTNALGGITSPTLSHKNTHLIYGVPIGKKYTTAKGWGGSCLLVSPYWLEQCYKTSSQINPQDFQMYSEPSTFLSAIGQLSNTNISDSTNNTEKKDVQNMQKYETPQTDNETTPPKQTPILENTYNSPKSELLTDISQSKSVLQKDIDPNEYLKVTDASFQPIHAHRDVEFKDITSQAVSTKSFKFKVDENSHAPSPSLADSKIDLNIHEDTSQNVTLETKESNNENSQSSNISSENITIVTGKLTELEQKMTSQGSPRLNYNHSIDLIPDTIIPYTESMEASLEGNSYNSNVSSSDTTKQRNVKRSQSSLQTNGDASRISKRSRNNDFFLPRVSSIMDTANSITNRALDMLSEVLQEEKMNSIMTSIHNATANTNQLYNIRAVCTGCLENIDELDREILKLLGITIYNDITESYKLNTIIAPKRMRTAKFLKSFSFEPLENILLPKFIIDLLKRVHVGERTDIELKVSQYAIPDIDTNMVYQATSSSTKVFQRAGIRQINLVNDIPGGADVIASILKAHGIQEVKITNNKFTLNDLLKNDTNVSEADNNEKTKLDYILLVNKATQVKRFKKQINEVTSTAMAIEWNWCVDSIFTLNVDFKDKSGIMFNNNRA